ncbi:MAG: hypothetical protein D6798_12005 [Deltaproteobacteria bacterium]|nr:MAG: hypothetical protein D6798_12005 [Deltaproteobacteria bacterium]
MPSFRLLRPVAAASLVLALACGGSLVPIGGADVGAYASSLATYAESENPGVDCPAAGVGDAVRIGDFSFRVDRVELSPPETRLPWIKNRDERQAFSKPGVQALVVHYSIRNESPVQAVPDVVFSVHGTDGRQATTGPYNAELVMKAAGMTAPTAWPPGQWVENVKVFDMQPAAADGAAAWLKRRVKQVDPTDPKGRRKIDVIVEQAVIDLGTPAAGAAISGD